MSLTIGTGPFGSRPGGVFNFTYQAPDHVLYFEDSARWLRAELGGETVASSKRMKMLHETGLLPVYYFPRQDVRMDLLEPTSHHTHCPFKGEASYWTFRAGDRVEENIAWAYPEPKEGAPPLQDYIAFYFERIDHWYEEEEEITVHPRDPYHRVDVRPSSRHIEVRLEGELLAESERPRLLFETGLPVRYYMPLEDARNELFLPSETVTRCAYKGAASYYSVKTKSGVAEDLVWYYPDPLPEAQAIKGCVCFYSERVDITLDGEKLPRPS